MDSARINPGSWDRSTSNHLTEAERSRLEDLFRIGIFEVESANVRRTGSDLDALIVASYIKRESGRRATGSHSVRQSIAYSHRPGTDITESAVQPKSGIGGTVPEKDLEFVGAPTVDLPSHRDFDSDS